MNLLQLPGQDAPDPGLLCSRKGCRQAATTRLLWNNPKIHTPERRKTWLACDDHVDWLQDYLQSRALWKETLPLEPSTGPAEPFAERSPHGEELQH